MTDSHDSRASSDADGARHHLDRATFLRGAAVGALGLSPLLAAACGSSKKNDQTSSTAPDGSSTAADEGTPVDGGSLVIGVAAETNGWNPSSNQWAAEGSLVGSSVLEPLATVGADKGAKPWLADSWIANDTFDSWVIHLHPGVTFQNGEAFTADVVKKNIEFYLSGTLSKIALGPMIDGVEVVDPLTVQVNLKQPWGAFPSAWMMGSSYMMAPAMLDSADNGRDHPIGTGPFTFDSWESGSSFKVKKNPTYWQAGLPHLDAIDFEVWAARAFGLVVALAALLLLSQAIGIMGRRRARVIPPVGGALAMSSTAIVAALPLAAASAIGVTP